MLERDAPNLEDRHRLTKEIPLLVNELGYKSIVPPREGRRLWMGSFVKRENQKSPYPRFHMFVQVRYDYDLGRVGVHLDVTQHLTGTDAGSFTRVSEEVSRLRTELMGIDSPGAIFIIENTRDMNQVLGKTLALSTNSINKMLREGLISNL